VRDTARETRSLRRLFIIAAAVIAALVLFYLATRVPPVEPSAPTVPPGETG
jgi:hypothetical protein